MEHRVKGMNRDKFRASTLLFLILMFCVNVSRSEELPAGLSAEDKEELAYTTGVQAFIYSYPLLHVNQFRHMIHSTDSPRYRGPANQLNHSRALRTASESTAASPNNDTLYTLAFLDLAQGPVLIHTPQMADRYFTIQLADAYASNIGDVGSRHTGGAPGKYLLVGPDWDGEVPPGIDEVFRSPTPWVMSLLRILIDSERELEEVHLLQDGFKLTTLEGKQLPPFPEASLPNPPASAEANDVWAVINRELTANPPPQAHSELIDQFAAIGVGPGQSEDIAVLDPAIQKGLARAATTGMKLVVSAADDIGGARQVNGWKYTRPDIGRYGNDFLYRAGVTRMGLMANDPIEAAYLSLYDDINGNPLNGKNQYVLRFAADNLPPAQAFWSITMYDRQSYKLVDNIANRFSIGDRSPGLQYNEDGSLTITISHDSPPAGQRDNWLPAPAGDFYLLLRVYNPEQVVIDQEWSPPGLAL
jgi:hypothetical protein